MKPRVSVGLKSNSSLCFVHFICRNYNEDTEEEDDDDGPEEEESEEDEEENEYKALGHSCESSGRNVLASYSTPVCIKAKIGCE